MKKSLEESHLNDTQKYILFVLENVLEIAEKMNLKCYMQGGTMLGAIRHKGFIPWDDDVDLGMMRDDYEYFLKHVEEHLPENMELRTYWDESEHHYYFARIVDNRHLIKRMGSAEVRYENVWVDIFPLDGMPNGGINLLFHKSKLSVARFFDCLKKCIHVSILAYDHFLDDKECYRRIAFCDTKTGKEYTDLMEMHILELSKLPPEEKNETSLLQWMRFLGGKTRKDFEEMAKKNSELEEAYDVLDKLSADEKKRLEYETRQRAIRDYNIGMLTAERRGIEAGRKIGREEGETLGVSRINQLILELSKHGRTDDIVKAAADKEYQEKLLKEFDL